MNCESNDNAMERRKKHSREEAVHVYIEDHDHDRRSHWTAIMMMYLSLAGDCCHNRRQPPSPQLQRGRKAKKKQKRKISISIFAYYYCYYVCLLLCCCCCCNVFPSISLEAITKQSMKKKRRFGWRRNNFIIQTFQRIPAMLLRFIVWHSYTQYLMLCARCVDTLGLQRCTQCTQNHHAMGRKNSKQKIGRVLFVVVMMLRYSANSHSQIKWKKKRIRVWGDARVCVQFILFFSG